MPTECETNGTPLLGDKKLETVEEASSSTNGYVSSGGTKISIISPDPTPYVARARVTRPIPPKPSCNPMQFVQIKPCNLYQSAQQQLKKAEEVKKIKEIKKEEPEDWQNNLDNWKSSRRKRVEHIIDRVVEVKKFELEEYDRSRRKSKTFSEMIEERGERPGRAKLKLASLAVYNEDESNDFSDLGIGTSSASGKSSISEDYDNNSVISDNADIEKIFLDNTSRDGNGREYISSPGYDTSSSTAPASSPDPCEYTYEGAIQEYKTRVSRATSVSNNYNDNKDNNTTTANKGASVTTVTANDYSDSNSTIETLLHRRGSKIENRLIGFEVNSPNNIIVNSNAAIKIDLPKIDILKRKEVFENHNDSESNTTIISKMRTKQINNHDDSTSVASESSSSIHDVCQLSGSDVISIKERLQKLEEQQNKASNIVKFKASQIDNMPVPQLKDRLSSLQNAATKEEIKKPPVVLVDLDQLERMKSMEDKEKFKQELMSNVQEAEPISKVDLGCNLESIENITESLKEEKRNTSKSSTTDDRNDSGIHIVEDSTYTISNNNEKIHHLGKEQIKSSSNKPSHSDQVHLNSNEITETTPVASFSFVNDSSNEMEFSINEALELALDAIDKETETRNNNHENRIIENYNQSTETTMVQFNQDLNKLKSAEKISFGGEPIYENITNVEPISVSHSSASSAIMQSTLIKTNCNSTLDTEISLSSSNNNSNSNDEPYYQVPKSSEPYYETPKNLKPIPVYENIEMFHLNFDNKINCTVTDDENLQVMQFKLEPPKEKPPPPPSESPCVYEIVSEEDNKNYCCDNWRSAENPYEIISDFTKNEIQSGTEQNNDESSLPIKRMNSTKRIKKELRNKRSSFLGIEGTPDDDENFLKIQMPPDMAQLLQEERRLEKQLYMKVGLCDSSDTGESRDSGVSENHSRQSSEPSFTNSSEEADRSDEVIFKNSISQKSCPQAMVNIRNPVENTNAQIISIEEKIREQEEVLRVERELLQFEQEEIKRQRENLMIHENLARRELQHGAKMLMSANRRSLQDLNGLKIDQEISNKQRIYANLPNQIYESKLTDHRKSMSDLQDSNLKKNNLSQPPPIPPTKPMRQMQYSKATRGNFALPLNDSLLVKVAAAVPSAYEYSNYHQISKTIAQPQVGVTGEISSDRQITSNSTLHGNMTRNTLHTLSATPKPKYTDGWVLQKRKSFDSNSILNQNDPGWLSSSYQQKRKSVPEGYQVNSHWLVQEAEQRRFAEQHRNGGYGTRPNSNSPQKNNNNISNKKPLPDSIIQTLTERVQNKGIGDQKRFENYYGSKDLSFSMSNMNSKSSPINQRNSLPNLGSLDIEPTTSSQQTSASDKVLSVSGKKKCSHCGDELGRGAAMIIESLNLFYHINCFKCCVCHIQLGDGLNGTDVRVRNHKLHCQNCYSSDDGVKFSCV